MVIMWELQGIGDGLIDPFHDYHISKLQKIVANEDNVEIIYHISPIKCML